MRLPMLSTDAALAEIRRLYFSTTRETIQRDLERALDLLKGFPSEDERERATVYMEGLAQMRSDWGKNKNPNKKRNKSAKKDGNTKGKPKTRAPRK